PVAKPSPALVPAARGPKIELPLEDEPVHCEVTLPEPESELAVEESSAPDWLEPLSPMPEDTADTPGPRSRLERERDETPVPEAPAPEAELLDLEEVVAEDTSPPTPRPRVTRVTAAPAPEPTPFDETEPELGAADDEPAFTEADDDGACSWSSLVRGESGDPDEEAVLAELGPTPAREPDDFAPVRRSGAQAKPSPLARPTPAVATPAKPTPAKPAPARVTLPRSRANGGAEFDLSGPVDADEPPAAPQPTPAP